MTNAGSPPADLDSDCAQIGISSAPSPASPHDVSKVAAETNPPFHGTEGDQTELDDLVRLLGEERAEALARAKVRKKHKKIEKLEKRIAQKKAELSHWERWLNKKSPRDSRDPRVKEMKIPPAPASPTADLSNSARPAQETHETADSSSPASANARRPATSCAIVGVHREPLSPKDLSEARTASSYDSQHSSEGIAVTETTPPRARVTRRGRPFMYDRAAIHAVGEEVLRRPDPPGTIYALAQEVSTICTERKIPVPKNDTNNRYLRELLTGIYNNLW